jgi:hypothetical protein
MKTIAIASFVLVALLAFLPATPAGAREYIVHSCKTPAGQPAPTDGWQRTGNADYSWFNDGCSRGEGLQAGLFGNTQPANQSNIGWGFDSGEAPITAYRIERRGTVHDASRWATILLFTADAENVAGGGRQIDYCTTHAGCAGIAGVLARALPQIPEDSHSWFITIGCGGSPGAFCALAPGTNDFGSFAVTSASFTLVDPEPPAVLPVEGSLTREGAIAGDLRFEASDAISGVRRAVIEADGREIVAVVPDDNRGRCAELGQSGATPDFLYRRPCPARAQVELTLPAGALPAGEHTLRARVFDAAGNSLTAFGPRRVEVVGAAVTTLASARFVPEGSSAMKAAYGRNLRVSGMLLANTGLPLAGESIELTMTAPAARRARIVKRLVTDAAGRYEFWIRATASRRLRLHHPATNAALEQRLTVRSRIRLSALRSRVRPLGRMRLTGSIESERARRGASVAIKVRTGGTWRTVGIARSNTRGRFSFSYRFRRTRHARFVFRAVALASSDLAVAARPSRSVRVWVG